MDSLVVTLKVMLRQNPERTDADSAVRASRRVLCSQVQHQRQVQELC